MRLTTEIGGKFYWIDHEAAISIGIQLRFDEAQPSLFSAPPAVAEPLQVGDFIGDTKVGGSCNVFVVQFNPHCNGTHTESIAHITDERIPVATCVDSFAALTALVSLLPEPLEQSGETYADGQDDDLVVTAHALAAALDRVGSVKCGAVVIRTMPNSGDKLTAHYGDEPCPPYFTRQAIELLDSRNVRHLIVDLPSIDRVLDGGRLLNHHAFWHVERDSRRATEDSRSDRTITEFAFVPDNVTDGLYVLNLQMADFDLDVAPSRPLLIPLVPMKGSS